MDAEGHDAAFDKIMATVGDSGKFQKIFNYIFNFFLTFFSAMVFMNIILAMSVPDHWCHVPGREDTNYTIEEWRNLTLPKNLDTNVYSSCLMYNISENESVNTNDWNFQDRETVECKFGWEYDKKWWETTAVSQEDWVCEKDLYQTNVFMLTRLGETFGTLLFGHIGDTYGRKIVYYLSLVLILIGRVISIFLAPWFIAFAILIFVGSLTGMTIFQTPLIIAMEISNPDDRATITMYQCLAWSAGNCALPLLYWWVRDWIVFLLITTCPLVLFFFFPKYMVESPRWLITKRNFKKTVKVLKKIGKINGIKSDISENYLRKMLPEHRIEKNYGLPSLFSSPRLALNTIVLVTCWIVCSLSYFTLILYIAQLPGNPFINFLGQSIAEVPSFIMGQYGCNKIGRRLTNVLSFVVAAILCIPTIIIANNDDLNTPFIVLTVLMKLCATVTFFAVNLQSMETYPTCLRQTGISLGAVASNVVGICGPYIVYLGTHFDRRYPYVLLLVLFVISAVCGLFLPETLHQKLPDSLDEAKVFGKDQKFWSFKIPRLPVEPTDEDKYNKFEIEKLNPSNYST